MRRYRLKPGYSMHHQHGHVMGPDEIPGSWLTLEDAAALIEAGSIEEIKEDPPATPAAVITEARPGAGRKGK